MYYHKFPLADTVNASCTVYPYVYHSPVKLLIKNQVLSCIDAGSLCCEPPTIDPTAHFLKQLLGRITSNDRVSIYFLANAFTQSIDYQAIEKVLQEHNPTISWSIYYDEGAYLHPNNSCIEIINIPVITQCSEIFEEFLQKTPFILHIKFLKAIFEKIVGRENAIPNLLAAGVVPVLLLKKEAHKIIENSQNFRTMLHVIQAKY